MRKFKKQQVGWLMTKEMIDNLFKPPKEYEKKDTEIRNDIKTSENVDTRDAGRDGYNENLFI